MAEQIPFSIAENLLAKLASIASEEVSLVHGFKKDLRKLQTTLSTIKAILVDAEEKQEESLAVKDWIRRLREVVYDADDLFDDVATEGLRRKVEGEGRMVRKVCDFFSSTNQIAFRFKMGHSIKDIRERLDEIAKEISDFGFIIRKEVGVCMGIKNSWRETDSFVLKSEIIGRDEDKEKIIESLMCSVNQSNISVVAIVGFGGLGKTALAQLVFNDEKVVNYFDLKLWVCVSEESNVETLVKLILKSAGNNEVPNLSLERLQIRLRQCLEGKKFLLVLDDVWNVNNRIWSQLRRYLMVGAIGSRILVTTRSKRVALAMGVDSPYALQDLTEDQSWDLFEKLAFREGTGRVNSNLIEIGKEIAKKCRGVPLAIRAIGGIMQLRSSESEWLSVLENELWKVFESDGDISQVLKLSYDVLPYHLKQCFAYCAMFPKDYEFGKDRLIQLWMAQGYVQSRGQSENENAEEIGEGYFNELLFRSFFQKFKYCYKMHDLIHDLAQSIAGDSCFVVNDNTKYIPDRVQHVFSENLSFEECFRQLKNKGLRTLYCPYFGDGLWLNLDSIFSNCRSIRALSFGWNINGMPDSIGKLKYLRYLEFSSSKISSLPNCICSLYNLQTLILWECWGLKELPTDMRKLICLRQLINIGCSRLEFMPLGLGRLTNLQTLSTFVVGSDQGRRCSSLNELNSLNRLRGEISIEGLENVKNAALESSRVNLKEKKHLLCLRLRWDGRGDSNSGNSELLLDNLHPHPNLKELNVVCYEGVRFSNWLSSITNLVNITLYKCPKCEHLPPLDNLPYLEILNLSYFDSLEYISDEYNLFSSLSTSAATFFPSLKILKLDVCPNVKRWWRTRMEAKMVPQFPCLSKLTIAKCRNLTLMPMFPSLDMELHLAYAHIRPLHYTLQMSATASAVPSTSSSVTSPFSKLKTLWLQGIENLASLPGEWMQNLSFLEKLFLSYCMEISDEDECGIFKWRYLVSLRDLSLYNLSNLVSLPRELQYVTTLQRLSIHECSNLRALPNWIGNLTALENLNIHYCSKLESLPRGMRQITTLHKLSVTRCPHLSERCAHDMAADWPNISHIPNIQINGNDIQREGRYLL
ncbi:putative disease resistance protein RGA4 [Manihot esculenta]|nr:putative disease resistance protein RGA4 [Manihot esculenta]XP_043817251.1 putative disease resistance protein RGA4 [Manihot esculenta]